VILRCDCFEITKSPDHEITKSLRLAELDTDGVKG
jgi:hypothetical protein